MVIETRNVFHYFQESFKRMILKKMENQQGVMAMIDAIRDSFFHFLFENQRFTFLLYLFNLYSCAGHKPQ